MTDDEIRIKIAKLKGYGLYLFKPAKINDAVSQYDIFSMFLSPKEFEDYSRNEYWIVTPAGWPEDYEQQTRASVVPLWSTDTHDTWALVREFEAAGLRWMMYTLPEGGVDFAVFQPEIVDNVEGWQLLVEAQGAPLVAICLAYIQWKERPIEN